MTADVPAPALNMLKAKALHTALSDAVLFTTARAVGLPMLEGIRLEFGGGHLVAVATDRFTLGASRVDYDGVAFDMLLGGDDAKKLIALAKTGKRDEGWREVVVEVTDADTVPRVTFRFTSGESMTVRGSELDFPKWRLLIEEDHSRMGSVVGAGYDPSRLARFAKVRPEEAGGRGGRMILYPTVSGNGRPGMTAIRIGDNFVGAMLPERPDVGDAWPYDRPGWVTKASAAASGPEGGR